MVVREPVRVLFVGSLGEAAARAPITQERSKGPLQARSERHSLPPRLMAPSGIARCLFQGIVRSHLAVAAARSSRRPNVGWRASKLSQTVEPTAEPTRPSRCDPKGPQIS